MAQLVEQHLSKCEVLNSNLSNAETIEKKNKPNFWPGMVVHGYNPNIREAGRL
jgi:hypothetical protein